MNFGSVREDLTVRWRTLGNEQLHTLCSEPNKLRRWEDEKRILNLVGNSEGKIAFGGPRHKKYNIKNLFSESRVWGCGRALTGYVQGYTVDSYGHCNEYVGISGPSVQLPASEGGLFFM